MFWWRETKKQMRSFRDMDLFFRRQQDRVLLIYYIHFTLEIVISGRNVSCKKHFKIKAARKNYTVYPIKLIFLNPFVTKDTLSWANLATCCRRYSICSKELDRKSLVVHTEDERRMSPEH